MRLQDIGASPERVRVSGNLKFDIPAPVPPAIVETVRASIAGAAPGRCWYAAVRWMEKSHCC